MFWGINLSSFGLCGKGFYPPRGLPGVSCLSSQEVTTVFFFFFLFRDLKLCASLVSDTFDWGGRQVKGSALGRRLAFDVSYMSRDAFFLK